MLSLDTNTQASDVSILSAGRDPMPSYDRLSGTNPFPGQLESTLRRLRASRVRFSVMRLRLSRGSAGDPAVAEKLVAHMADPHILVGLWRDHSVVAAFFGPRVAIGSAGDRAQVRQIVERCRRALIEIGEADLVRQAHLLIAHRWTDEVYDLPALIETLDLAEEKEIAA